MYIITHNTDIVADVSATELARNLGDVLARVRYRGQTFLVRKNGKVIARIEPAGGPDGPPAREAFAAWVAAAAPDPGFAEDLERAGHADRPRTNA
jgi:antitoxin (DNA-binding transcriptional repressor) of toxin-antitoxin stability system